MKINKQVKTEQFRLYFCSESSRIHTCDRTRKKISKKGREPTEEKKLEQIQYEVHTNLDKTTYQVCTSVWY